ncbi:transcriptional regulator [Streptosporangium oxazolinicum]
MLSKHLKVLRTAGYVKVTKTSGKAARSTWIAITFEGRRAPGRAPPSQ